MHQIKFLILQRCILSKFLDFKKKRCDPPHLWQHVEYNIRKTVTLNLLVLTEVPLQWFTLAVTTPALLFMYQTKTLQTQTNAISSFVHRFVKNVAKYQLKSIYCLSFEYSLKFSVVCTSPSFLWGWPENRSIGSNQLWNSIYVVWDFYFCYRKNTIKKTSYR